MKKVFVISSIPFMLIGIVVGFIVCLYDVIINKKGVVIHDPSHGQRWKRINIIESGDMLWWALIEKQSA